MAQVNMDIQVVRNLQPKPLATLVQLAIGARIQPAFVGLRFPDGKVHNMPVTPKVAQK